MRLGKDVLEADLYGVLGVLPDATASEIRVAYRRQARVSHPDLNREDPEAAARMKQLNMAARVLLDAALRSAYDRAPRGVRAPRSVRPARGAAWYERREQRGNDDWADVPPDAAREYRSSFGGFFAELRGRQGQVSLQLQELVESMSVRQQLGVAALLFAAAIGLIVIASPKGLIGDSVRPTSVDVGSLYP